MDSSTKYYWCIETEDEQVENTPYEDPKLAKKHCKRCHQLVPKCSCSLGPKLRGK